jgi:enamine deaminase RidA (YjgF/YER057c/UK114 family)
MEAAMKQQRVDPGWAWTKKFNISAGAKLGDTVHLSGIVALDNEGNVVAAGDVYGQSKRVFANIEEALASAGATMADVVKITTYLTDISTYADFARARTEAFPGGVPASTAVATPALVMPELLVEVEAMAVIGSGS